jgi:hypothetical protein
VVSAPIGNVLGLDTFNVYVLEPSIATLTGVTDFSAFFLSPNVTAYVIYTHINDRS